MQKNTIINDIFEHIVELLEENYFGERPKQSAIAYYLDSANGPNCSLPLDYNLIHHMDFSIYLPRHLSAIDDFLAEYEDTTGEAYPARSLGELLWTAVEWYAHKLAYDKEFYDSLEQETGIKIERDTE